MTTGMTFDASESEDEANSSNSSNSSGSSSNSGGTDGGGGGRSENNDGGSGDEGLDESWSATSTHPFDPGKVSSRGARRWGAVLGVSCPFDRGRS